MIAVRIKEQEIPIVHSMLTTLDLETILSGTYNMVVRGEETIVHLNTVHHVLLDNIDEFISQIQLGGRYHFICYSIYDSHSNQILFEVTLETNVIISQQTYSFLTQQ